MIETLLLVNILICFYSLKTFSIAAPNALSSFYITACLLSFYTITTMGLTKEMLFFTAMPIDEYGEKTFEIVLTYTFLNCLSLLFKKKKPLIQPHNKNFKILKKLPRIKYTSVVIILLLLLNCVNLLHIANLDTNILMSNDDYLTIKTPDAIGITNDFFRIYHFLFRFIGAAMVIVLCDTIYQKKGVAMFLSSLYVGYCTLFLTAGASRWLAVYIALALLYVIIKKPRHKGVIITALIAATFFSFLVVLMGRSSGNYGVSHLTDYLDEFKIKLIPVYITGILVNIFEGVFNLANSIKLEPHFDLWYINHSFLPLPSFVDDFTSKINIFAWKFAPHVPMSAISESYTFGIQWFAIYIILYFAFLKLSMRAFFTMQNASLRMALMAPTYYILIAQHTYSLRTMIKPMIFLSILFLYLSWKGKRSRSFSANPVAPRQLK